ncbi:MAG TPA: non-heme iron oxygenase ferredoxin subunit [bacterium]|nr:non-heme iron oxygenase ferredoxin subunit [bacterium]HPN36136.1 non-heme iron oxygenase ferredoxin subunit [bacterium]
MPWISLMALSELVENIPRSVRVSGKKLLVLRQGDRVYAMEDRCTHEDNPLVDGAVSAGKIACPRHGALFDLASGAALTPPAYEAVNVYPVTVEKDVVQIDVTKETGYGS